MAYLNERLQSTGPKGKTGTPMPSAFRNYLAERKVRPLLPVVVQLSPRLRAQSSNITGSITKVEIIWNGAVVTQVPVGDHFDVRVYFSANNPGGGNWTVAATVVATDGSNAHFDVFNVTLASSKTGSFLIQDAQSSSAPFVMPNGALTLRVTLWGYLYSVGGSDFRTAVPQSQW
jgi:hypothetical protein